MYYPYFRGRQYELIAIRESSSTFADKNFVPIIEPVKKRLSSLHKTLDKLHESGAHAIIIANPQTGDHSNNNSDIIKLIKEKHPEQHKLICGLLLTKKTTVAEAIESCEKFDAEIALIHGGFPHAKELSREVSGAENINAHIFFENRCGKL